MCSVHPPSYTVLLLYHSLRGKVTLFCDWTFWFTFHYCCHFFMGSLLFVICIVRTVSVKYGFPPQFPSDCGVLWVFFVVFYVKVSFVGQNFFLLCLFPCGWDCEHCLAPFKLLILWDGWSFYGAYLTECFTHKITESTGRDFSVPHPDSKKWYTQLACLKDSTILNVFLYWFYNFSLQLLFFFDITQRSHC